MYAAGLTLKKKISGHLWIGLNSNVNSTITEEQLVPRIFIDTELSFSEINEEFFKTMSQFQPFGPETCHLYSFHGMYLNRIRSNGWIER